MTNQPNLNKQIELLKAENEFLKKQLSEFNQKNNLYLIFDKFHFPVYITDIETKIIIYANKKASKTFGNITGKKCWEAFHEKEICDECEYQRLINNSEKFPPDFKRESYIHKNKRWYLLFETYYSDNGLKNKKITVALDINERKKIQKENSERTQNLRLLFNNVNDPIFVIRDNKFRFVNRATENFFGNSAEKILQDSLDDYTLHPYKSKILNVCHQILEENQKGKQYYLKLKNAKGEIRDVNVKTDVVFWKGEKSILVVLKDITEERIKNKKNIETQRFYKILFEHSPIPILLFQGNNIVLFNNALKKYLKGYDFALLQNVDKRSFIHPDSVDIIKDAIMKLKNGKDFVSAENVKLYNIERNIINVSLVFSLVKYKSKSAYLIIFNDITARIKAEGELKKTISVKDKFLSIIAHDLRNPFNQILGFADLLKDEIYKNDINKIKRLSEYIYLSAENGNKLLENLLSWAKTQTGSVMFQPENLNFKETAEEVISFFQTNSQNKQIKIRTEGIDDSICIFFDKEMLKTILRNLISNALKYTERGGEIEIVTYDKVDYVQINVSDNGIGMTEEQKNKVFKLDESFTMTGTENERGSGLGLAVCKEFVEKNSGKIFVESEKGKGSTFSFTAKKCMKEIE